MATGTWRIWIMGLGATEAGRRAAAWTGCKTSCRARGDAYLRRLLVLGATAVVRYARGKPEKAAWVNALLARRPARVVTVAVANKLARTAWALLTRGGTYQPPRPAVA